MNYAELVEKVAEATGIPKAEANRAVEAIVQTITEAAKAGDEVRVTGLGIFDVVTREARPGRTPQTGESSALLAGMMGCPSRSVLKNTGCRHRFSLHRLTSCETAAPISGEHVVV
jgi:DNA-binding protein HU-beta